ncbi:glycosyltransferase family 4 protein [Arsenicicoccus bolidensis]|uniref:glycosyltransferase family 4 protein n=1 Tax=Arsenicicoccus bolidensis TaxID=229480 RepID=UPI001EF57A09|nr:glycosyltransferase [Arsenicicoccus bolidensis]
MIKRDNLSQQARKYAVGGRAESETLRLTRHVIGRTTWDRAVAHQINPEAAYFTVPETLRPAFYDARWTLDACQRKSLFVSQGHYPVKGLHFVLQAMPLILERHPEAQLWVSGLPPRAPGLRGRLKQTRYATHLRDMVRTANLEEHVHYTGVLDEVSMRDQYLSSHVFLSASTVENESNSLSEAKLLGMPVIASYVGGVVDRIDHGRSGWFYQHDAPYMLAYYVDQVFRDDQRARTMGEAARTDSLLLNDPGRNARVLCDVYARILQNPAV